MDKLKPCPFCGGNVIFCGDDPKDIHDCDQIFCDKCKINFDSYHETVKNCNTFEEAKTAMAKLWNNRNEY